MELKNLNGEDAAELLGVSPSALSRAANAGHYSAGEPVFDWAVRSPSGRITGYDIPEEAARRLFEKASAQEGTSPEPTPTELSLQHSQIQANGSPDLSFAREDYVQEVELLELNEGPEAQIQGKDEDLNAPIIPPREMIEVHAQREHVTAESEAVFEEEPQNLYPALRRDAFEEADEEEEMAPDNSLRNVILISMAALGVGYLISNLKPPGGA